MDYIKERKMKDYDARHIVTLLLIIFVSFIIITLYNAVKIDRLEQRIDNLQQFITKD